MVIIAVAAAQVVILIIKVLWPFLNYKNLSSFASVWAENVVCKFLRQIFVLFPSPCSQLSVS